MTVKKTEAAVKRNDSGEGQKETLKAVTEV